MKPMLAFRTKPSRLVFPIIGQRKYNGLRALWMPEHQTLQSRDELLYAPEVIAHLLTELTSLPFVVDGEIYAHGMSLQAINSRMGVNRKTAHADAAAVGYVIYDIPSTKPMWQRVQDLEKLDDFLLSRVKDGRPQFVTVASTVTLHSQIEADYWYTRFREEKFEGLMYRDYYAPYGFEARCGNKENRWWCLQKRKGTMDITAEIVGMKEGERSFEGMLGAFECKYKHPDGTEVWFDSGSGLDMDQRMRYWHNPDSVMGQPIEIEFEMFSDGRRPLKPIVSLVHEKY